MSQRLAGRVALITGGAAGIGAATAVKFAQEGATVIAADLRELTYDEANVHYKKLNVTDVANCEAIVKETLEEFKRIDILVNNAGITKDALVQKMTDEMWDAVIAVNLKGVFNLTRIVGPMMMEQNYGSIINISSVVGEYGNIGQTNYAATKAGVIGMTKTWAKEFARKGANVRCNAIAPGYIMTDILKTVPQDMLDKFSKATMLGRLGEPHEIANAALFLASEESSYVTGHVLSVNGGMRL